MSVKKVAHEPDGRVQNHRKILQNQLNKNNERKILQIKRNKNNKRKTIQIHPD